MSNSEKILTVVIPTRNEERNIGACINAFSESLDWIDIIVVDN